MSYNWWHFWKSCSFGFICIYLFLVVLGLRCCMWAACCGGFSCCESPAARVWAQQLWHTGLVALWFVESSHTRDWTHVPHIGRKFLTTGPPGKSDNSLKFGEILGWPKSLFGFSITFYRKTWMNFLANPILIMSMGLQRVGHDWVTELNWTKY